MNRKAAKRPGTKTRSTGGMVLGLVLMGIFICELLVYTWCRVQCTRVGYEIAQATSEQARMTRVQKELKLELARLKSPERLAGIAETSMGLQIASPRQVVNVE